MDFLFYYLTYWFDKNKYKLGWSTPIQRSTYAIGLMTMGLLYSLNECFELGKNKSLQFHIPWFVYLICSLSVMKLYDYIYITKGRYQKLVDEKYKKFNLSNDNGAAICMGIVAIGVLSPFIVSTIFIPFGGHALSK